MQVPGMWVKTGVGGLGSVTRDTHRLTRTPSSLGLTEWPFG